MQSKFWMEISSSLGWKYYTLGIERGWQLVPLLYILDAISVDYGCTSLRSFWVLGPAYSTLEDTRCRSHFRQWELHPDHHDSLSEVEISIASNLHFKYIRRGQEWTNHGWILWMPGCADCAISHMFGAALGYWLI